MISILDFIVLRTGWRLERRNLPRIGFVLLIFSTLILGDARSAAAVTDCAEVRDPVPGAASEDAIFKLVLDEFAGTSTAGEAAIVHRSLLTKLQDNFDKARLEMGRFHIVLCLGRSPVQVNDIMGYVDSFAAENVVLETWGFFDGDEATLIHAFIPLLAQEAEAWRPDIDHFRTTYTYDGGGELRFLKDVVSSSVEVRIFAALGAASAAYASKDFDRARTFFCRSLLMLEQHGSRDQGFSDNTRTRDLTEFARTMSLKVVEDAAQDSGYGGRMGSPLIPVGTKCERDLS